MLDKLVLHIPFKLEYLTFYSDSDTDSYVDLNALPNDIPLTGDIVRNEHGHHIGVELRTKFESLPSSHSGMAMKIYNEGMNCDPFVMIKCSPAKLLQGHNLYGFDDLEKSGFNMLALLSSIYPDLYKMLDIKNTEVSELDITYSIFIKNPETKKLFLDHLRYVSKGQTKNRGDNYETSIYFGSKQSRLKKTKVYSKLEEMKNDIKEVTKKGYVDSAKIMTELLKTDYCKNAVRFESTIKKRYLERRMVPTNFFKLCKFIEKMPAFYSAMWQQSWKEIFEALNGMEIVKTDNESVYNAIYNTHHTVNEKTGNVSTTKVRRLFSLYQNIKSLGYEHVREQNRINGRISNAFNKSIRELLEAGFSRSHLQNLHKDSGATVIQIARIIQVDFGKQQPEDYVMPLDLFG